MTVQISEEQAKLMLSAPDLLQALENNFRALQEAFRILNNYAEGPGNQWQRKEPGEHMAFVYQALATVFEPTREAILAAGGNAPPKKEETGS